MFSPKEYRLNKEGLKDCKNASHLLKVHEDSQEHNTHMATWKELEVVLQSGLQYISERWHSWDWEIICDKVWYFWLNRNKILNISLQFLSECMTIDCEIDCDAAGRHLRFCLGHQITQGRHCWVMSPAEILGRLSCCRVCREGWRVSTEHW